MVTPEAGEHPDAASAVAAGGAPAPLRGLQQQCTYSASRATSDLRLRPFVDVQNQNNNINKHTNSQNTTTHNKTRPFAEVFPTEVWGVEQAEGLNCTRDFELYSINGDVLTVISPTMISEKKPLSF